MLKILKRIFFFRFIIINPKLFIKRIIFKINLYLSKKKYDQSIFLSEQNQIFKNNNLDRKFGINTFSKIADKYKFLNNDSSSEHQILLCAISDKKNIKNILEIGTYDGTNSFLISQLFPNSYLETIDLSDDDETFKKTYGRQDYIQYRKLINTREKILKENANINFYHKNSVSLITEAKKFDLIWIDGAHGYPVVTIDIINSLRLLNKNGIILCDDVWIDKPYIQDKIYNSLATFETLNELKQNHLVDYNLFYKRLDVENNSFKDTRKYIAFVKKLYE